MISIFPNRKETLVLTLSWEEISQKISNELLLKMRPGLPSNFTGWIKDDRFQLTIRLRRQHLFMPVINGVIEPTSKGSIIFINYSLFPATRFLLAFWTVIIPVTGISISVLYNNYVILTGGMTVLALMYVIAWSNFTLHLRSTREILHKLLN